MSSAAGPQAEERARDRAGELVCYCFEVGRSDLARAATAGDPEEPLRRIVGEVRAGRCACEVKNPTGRCCLGTLRRVIDELQVATARDRPSPAR